MIKSILKCAAFSAVAALAYKAGEQLWAEGLSSKASIVIAKLKSKFQKKGS